MLLIIQFSIDDLLKHLTQRKRKDGCIIIYALTVTYSSKSIENEIIKRGYIPHISYKRKRGQKKEMVHQQKHSNL